MMGETNVAVSTSLRRSFWDKGVAATMASVVLTFFAGFAAIDFTAFRLTDLAWISLLSESISGSVPPVVPGVDNLTSESRGAYMVRAEATRGWTARGITGVETDS